MTVCENPFWDKQPRCTLTIQDERGAVASYNNALIHTLSTYDGLVSITVDSDDGWVRERPQGIVERDLTARIEAAIATLEADPFTGAITQALKILKGKI